MTAFTESISFTAEAETQDDTAMGDDWRQFLGGLLSGSMDVTFNQDFAAGAVDATLWSVLGTSAAWVIRPTTEAVGAANPQFSGVGLLTSYSPVMGTVGDGAKTTVSIICKSSVTRSTA